MKLKQSKLSDSGSKNNELKLNHKIQEYIPALNVFISDDAHQALI